MVRVILILILAKNNFILFLALPALGVLGNQQLGCKRAVVGQ